MPEDINLYEYKDSKTGSALTDKECRTTADDTGVLCEFKKEGFYCAKAGKKMLVIKVTK